MVERTLNNGAEWWRITGGLSGVVKWCGTQLTVLLQVWVVMARSLFTARELQLDGALLVWWCGGWSGCAYAGEDRSKCGIFDGRTVGPGRRQCGNDRDVSVSMSSAFFVAPLLSRAPPPGHIRDTVRRRVFFVSCSYRYAWIVVSLSGPPTL